MTTISEVDDIDRNILQLLESDARRTYGDVGRHVGLSAPAVKRRIDRLQEIGIIVGFTTVVDHARLGRPLEAFAELRFSGGASVEDISRVGDGIPEVQAVFTVAGDPDAIAWVRVSDVTDLKRVIDRLRSKQHVTGTKTLMVLGTSRPAS